MGPTESDNDDSNTECANRTLMFNYPGKTSNDQDDVAQESKDDSPANCLITTPVGIRDVGSNEGRYIAPVGRDEGLVHLINCDTYQN